MQVEAVEAALLTAEAKGVVQVAMAVAELETKQMLRMEQMELQTLVVVQAVQEMVSEAQVDLEL
jgi:hypothetical protein